MLIAIVAAVKRSKKKQGVIICIMLFFGRVLLLFFFAFFISLPVRGMEPVDQLLFANIGDPFLEEKKLSDSLLTRGIELLNNHDLPGAFEKLNRVREIAADTQDYTLKFLAVNHIGIGYYNSTKFARALKYFQKAHNIAKENLDEHYKFTAMNNMALLFSAYDNQHEESIKYLHKVFEKAQELKMFDKAAQYGVNLSMMYNKTGDYEKSREIIGEIEQLNFDHQETKVIANTNLAESYFLEQEFEKSRDILLEILDKGEVQGMEVIGIVKYRLSRVLFEKNSHEHSQRWAKKGLKKAKEYDDLALLHDLYDLKSQIAYQLNKHKEAYKFQRQSKKLYSEIHELRNQTELERLKAQHEVSQYEYLLQIAEERQQSIRIYYLSALSFIILIIVFAAYSFRIRWLNIQKKNAFLRKKEEVASLKLDKKTAQEAVLKQRIIQEKEKAELEEKLLHEKLAIKNKEISSKAANIVAKNDLINDVINKLDKSNYIDKRNLYLLKRELNSTIKIDDEWQEFIMHFEKTHPDFFKKLKHKHPGLNNNDLRLAAYLRINLSGKEIARLLNIAFASYRKRKNRLKIKMELDNGTCLDNYIHQI